LWDNVAQRGIRSLAIWSISSHQPLAAETILPAGDMVNIQHELRRRYGQYPARTPPAMWALSSHQPLAVETILPAVRLHSLNVWLSGINGEIFYAGLYLFL
jgi:hypothetical protein